MEHRLRAGARSGEQPAPATSRCRCAIRRRRRRRTIRCSRASPYWGDEPIWDSQTSAAQSDARRQGPRLVHLAHPWAADRGVLPEGIGSSVGASSFRSSGPGASCRCTIRRPQKFTLIDTCFSTHHLQFDAKNRLWASSGVGGNGNGDIVGWLDVKKFEETGDEQKSQGWTPIVLDTNGNGKRDEGYVEPNQPVDPAKDKRVVAGFYGIAPSPADGTIWGSVLGFPGVVVRLDPATIHLARRKSTRCRRPAIRRAASTSTATASSGRRSRAATWAASTAASARARSTDRPRPASIARKAGRSIRCPDRNSRASADPGSAEASYYTLVDQHDTFGLGKDMPIATGNNSDSLHVLVDGKFIELRVPYPMGFFAKGLDGRIDDPNAGWKGTRSLVDLRQPHAVPQRGRQRHASRRW